MSVSFYDAWRSESQSQYNSIYVIIEQLVMLATPSSVCNVSWAWVKYKKYARLFLTHCGANGGGREGAHMN